MKTIKVRGLVLREFEAGESDKRLIIFCKGQGRLMVYARGARKPSSKFMAAAQLFTYADFVLAKGQGFYSLTQAEVIQNFYTLRQDYDRLMAAHLIAEVCEKTLWDSIESDSLLLLALKSLDSLAKGKVLPLQTSSVFLMRFFDVYGLRPQIDACVICNTPAHEIARKVLCAEGIVCEAHKPTVSHRLSDTVVYALGHIWDNNLTGAFMFTATPEVLTDLRNAAHFLWRCHFEWELKSEKI